MDLAWTRRGFSALWILALMALIGAAFALTFSLANREVGAADFYLSATWPETLGMTQPTVVVGTLRGESPTAWSSGVATLYVLPRGSAHYGAVEAFGEGRAVELATASVAEHGVFALTVAPVRDWTEQAREAWSEQGASLVLRVRIGEQDRYLWHELSTGTAKAAIALTLDRPLYQPGQNILMRAVVVDSKIGRPLEAAEVHWRMHDPQGNLVFDQRAPTSRAGVASAGYELASQCLQGDYKISVEAGGASAEQVISVLPFRLPRFAVKVSSEKPSVQPGELLSWSVEAHYTHGEAVAGAKVKTLVSWRTWDAERSTTLEGISDAKGQISQSWTAPSELRPGSSVRLAAVVTTDAGRAEQASHGVSVAGSHPRAEIYALGRGAFVSGQENQAVAVVSDVRGKPLANERLTVFVSEQGGQRTIDLVTDESGRAIFAWQPAGQGSTVRMQARFPAHAMSLQNFDLKLRQSPHHLRALTPVARAGEPYTLLAEPYDQPRTLLLYAGETLVGISLIPASEELSRHSLTPSDLARGLSTLRVLVGDAVVDELPLWVRQKGSEHVLISPEAKSYAPTDTAQVNLSFAVVDEAAHTSPVTFGLVGVDEALYALKERADVPFEILLRQSSTTVAALLPMLDGLEEQDELGQQIAAAKFLAELEPAVLSSYHGRATAGFDLSFDFARLEAMAVAKQWSQGFTLVISLLLFLGVVLTWRSAQRSAFTTTRMGLVAAVALAAAIGGFVMASVLKDKVVVVIVVSTLLVVVLLALVTVRDRSLPVLWWLIACAGALALGVRTLLLLQAQGVSVEQAQYIPLLVVPVAISLLLAFAWAIVLLEREERAAGLALAGWCGAAVIGVLVLTLFVTLESKFQNASESVANAVTFGDARSPAPPAPREVEESLAFEEDMAQIDLKMMGVRGGSSRGNDRLKTTARPSARSASGAKGIGAAEPEAFADGAAAPAAPPPPPQAGTVRSWFPETMVWMPEIESDAKGNARVSFHVPDSITTWRLDAWAHSYDGRFGQGQTGLRVARPVFMELDLPTHLTDGDRIDVPATL
ncbi:MAG: hypothetical protein H0U74_10945, partial [Bradymonadaceae bacterium]|nr:hypothetical protein [Lujinxingiaceae bacterium]